MFGVRDMRDMHHVPVHEEYFLRIGMPSRWRIVDSASCKAMKQIEICPARFLHEINFAFNRHRESLKFVFYYSALQLNNNTLNTGRLNTSCNVKKYKIIHNYPRTFGKTFKHLFEIIRCNELMIIIN